MKKKDIIKIIAITVVSATVLGTVAGALVATSIIKKNDAVKAFEQTECGVGENAVRRPKEEICGVDDGAVRLYKRNYRVVPKEMHYDVTIEPIKKEEPQYEELPKTEASIDTYYNMLPANVQNMLVAEGFQITVEDINYLALTNVTNRTIKIDTRPEAYSGLLHEAAHVIDWYCNSPSQFPEFEAIRQAEAPTMVSLFPTNLANYRTPIEYFAQAYEMCILHPTEMQTFCPQTYNYVVGFANGL